MKSKHRDIADAVCDYIEEKLNTLCPTISPVDHIQIGPVSREEVAKIIAKKIKPRLK